ncbi:MAG: GGDEF domain-containing protein [Lentihominibacter sp.]
MFTSSCISNGIGIAMMLMLIITNREHINRNRLTRYLFQAVIVTFISCLAEIIGFAADGLPGTGYTIILYLCDSWLFVAVILITYLWLMFICCLTENSISGVMKGVILGIDIIGMLALIINLFFPVVFSLENNIYERQSMYWIFVVIGAIHILYGMILLDQTKRRDEVVVRFSAWIFLAPVAVGVVAQSIFFGISVIWVGVAVAIQGMASYLKNSLIFMDSLTGVYNHLCLKDLEREYSEKSITFTALMADLNDFKSINDEFGHGEGDQALIATAQIYSNSIAGRGRVIRCAGDEFVVIIRSVDEEIVSEVIKKINQGFDDYNSRNKLNYTLSASMGQAVFESSRQNFRDFLEVLDRKMYENKQKHYENAEYDRRKTMP